MRFFREFILLFVVLSTAACTTTVRHQKDYRDAFAQNREILIIPPEVEIYEVGMTTKKRLYTYEYNLEPIISDQVLQQLQDKSFRVKYLSRKDIHEQNLQAEVQRLYDIYKDSRNMLYAKVELDEKKAFNINNTVGNAASNIAEKNNVAFIAITDYSRAIKDTSSRVATVMMNLLLGSQTQDDSDVSVMIIGIIDAKTGKVLWTNRSYVVRGAFSSSSDKKKEEAEMKALVKFTLKPLNEKD
jgi:hypothetical protein